MQDPMGLMPQNQQQMPQGDLSLAGGPQMPADGLSPDGGGMGGGQTEKEMMAEMIMQVPIDQLMQMVQSMSPEEFADQITQAAIQAGMGQEEATAYSITLMKVIYERIQDETGQAITEITGQGVEPSLAGQPPQGPPGTPMGGMPPQGVPPQEPPMMGGM